MSPFSRCRGRDVEKARDLIDLQSAEVTHLHDAMRALIETLEGFQHVAERLELRLGDCLVSNAGGERDHALAAAAPLGRYAIERSR